jgi:hypothetical protein
MIKTKILYITRMVYVQLKKATTKGKKYTAVFYDESREKIATTSFGAAGYEDYTTHGDEERKRRYIDRHKTRENFADYKSAGSLSYHILWNKPSVAASYNDYIIKFKLKKY